MRSVLTFILIFTIHTIEAQNFLTEENKHELLELKEVLSQKRMKKESRVHKYLASHPNKSRSFVRNGNELSLIDVRNGQPVYYITHNDGSVRSCGVYELRTGGKFGIDIAGENTNIAVWDRGLPLASHSEFQDRLTNSDASSEFSFHSTHVTGTLLAGGINPTAKGFCPRGQARAFDWFQDTEEMIDEVLMNGLMVSNHSYGVPGGWNGSNWLGDAGISTTEDYRFGYYDAEAASFDAIAFNAPYYSIVVSAGNERGNSGDGTFPPDGPYDCITGFSTGKNVFTIGAVNKINGSYTQASDVVMSSFSSWGPVDDGRIKPDFCAPGVNLLSASNASTTSYGLSSGTSMASPSAAGVVALVNEAYFLYNNRFLKSSSLKALLIHTAHEAGASPGPDYSFGWGLISADNAVELIQNEDGRNRRIIEGTLQDGQVFEMSLSPLQGEKITATLVWTDRAGTVPARSLDPGDLMLVNDLDMRISDDSGNTEQPWVLNPATPAEPALRGDNFRDNVEKIEFDSPDARPYKLTVSHKSELEGGNQDFSLILEYQSEDAGIQNLYWVNGEGDWSDESQWSLSSGGAEAGMTPQENSKIVIDDNSIVSEGDILMIDRDYKVSGLVAFTNKAFTLDLNGHTLTIGGTTLCASDKFSIRNGAVIFSSNSIEDNFTISLDQTSLNNLNLSIDQENMSNWIIEDNSIAVDNFTMSNGMLSMRNSNLAAGNISFSGRITLEDVSLHPTIGLTLEPGLQLTETGSNSIEVSEASGVNLSLFDIDNTFEIYMSNASVQLLTQSELAFLNVTSSDLFIVTDLRVNQLVLSASAQLEIAPGSIIQTDAITINSDQDTRIRLSSPEMENPGSFDLSVRGKYCFDYLDIENIDLVGQSAVSIGENSSLVNGNGWFEGRCENLLFAEYSADYLCAGALSRFEDISDGNVINRRWTVNEEEVWGDDVMEYVFETAGTYMVGLEIEDVNGNTNKWTDEIIIQSSDIEDNRIIQNDSQLASLRLAETYQWYNYGRKLEGETDRVYLYNGAPGIYWVLTFEGDCNRRSEILDLGTRVVDLDSESNNILRMNNPVSDILNIHWLKNLSDVSLDIISTNGILVSRHTGVRTTGATSFTIADIPPGKYIIVIKNSNHIYVKRFIKIK